MRIYRETRKQQFDLRECHAGITGRVVDEIGKGLLMVAHQSCFLRLVEKLPMFIESALEELMRFQQSTQRLFQ